MKYKYVITRSPGANYVKAISSTGESQKVDLEKLYYQHQQYCLILEKLGLIVIKLPVNNKFPDGCFVEDPCVIYGNTVVKTILGVDSRKGEGDAICDVLKYFKNVKQMKKPGAVDGGDVIITENNIFIGNSARTNLEGIKQFKQLLKNEKLPTVIVIPVTQCLHLKSAATYIGKNIVLLSNMVEDHYFEDYKKICVPEEENYAADCLNINNHVLIPKKHPYTKKAIEKKGFKTIELEMSEFKKADGSITCLSLLF